MPVFHKYLPMDLVHGLCTGIGGESTHALRGATKKGAKELVEMCQEFAREKVSHVLELGKSLLTIGSSWCHWRACSSSKELLLHHPNSILLGTDPNFSILITSLPRN